MKPEFWISKWADNQIGFHQDNIHPLLVKYWPFLNLNSESRVLVPLCGKSKDMVWLAEQRHQVTGIELNNVAIESFSRENHLKIKNRTGDVSHSQNIDIINADVFKVSKKHTKKVGAVYERGSLIALPKNIRTDYINKLKGLLDPGTLILLITLEYKEEMISPPPFSISRNNVEDLYHSWCDVNYLETIKSDVKGLAATESVYQIKVR